MDNTADSVKEKVFSYSFYIEKNNRLYAPTDNLNIISANIDDTTLEELKNNVFNDIKISKDSINALKTL